MRLASLCFLCGAWLALELSVAPSLPMVTAAVLLTLLARVRIRNPLTTALLCLALGYAWTGWHAARVMGQRLPAVLDGQVATVVGTVKGTPSTGPGVIRLVLETDTGTARRLRLSWYDAAPVIHHGERWKLRVRLRQPVGFVNPGGFDYERWLFRQGIGATGYVLDSADNRRLEPGGADWRRWRAGIVRRIGHLTAALEFGSTIRALSVGDRSGLAPDRWRVLTATGTNHLLAISGLHVGMVAMLGYLLGRRLWNRVCSSVWNAASFAALFSVVLAFSYATLSGFAIPAQRATLMVLGGLWVMHCGRTLRAGHVLALALVVVLAADPLALSDAGLWLSFTAVAAIVWVGGAPQRGWLMRLGRVQFAVTLALAPVLLIFFQRVSVLAPLANLVAVPVITLTVVPLCLAGVAALMVSDALASALWLLADYVLGLLWFVLEYMAQLPVAVVHAPAPGAPALLLGALGLIMLLSPLRQLLWVPGCVLFASLFVMKPPPPAPGEFRLTVLDVGQGLAAVVETHRHVLVFDAGPRFRSGFDAGSGIVAPFLRSIGAPQVDVLVVSHGDMDHSGGVSALLSEMPVARVLATSPGPDAEFCRDGQTWRWDRVVFRIVHPVDAGLSGNDASCVLHIRGPGGAALLPGDIEARGERELVRRLGAELHAEVLLAPHHGSRSSSTRGFVHSVSPQLVVVPAGYANRFGLPHESVVARYTARQARVLTTGCMGAISVEMKIDGSRSVWNWREERGGYWGLRPCSGDQLPARTSSRAVRARSN